jgi:hypothetical protein
MNQVQEQFMTKDTSLQAKRKFTAAHIEKDCPERLRQIGKEITARLAKAEKQTELARNHFTAIEQLLAEAKKICDDGGFKKFRELFCPQLGKSQAYALLAIAAGKKTLAEHRANTRARTARSRAKQKAESSATVADKSEPEPSERQESPPEVAPVDAPSIVPDQRPVAAAPKRAVTSKDEALIDFTARVLDLVRRTRRQKVGRFAKTAVKADDLAKLGKFLTDLADLKKPSAESVEQSTSRVQ